MNGISWLVRLVLDKDSRTQLEQDVADTAKRAGAKMGAGGEVGAKAFLAKAKDRFTRDSAELREELYRGLVNKKEADRRGKQLAKEFNDAILAEIKRRGDLGILTQKDFAGLSGSLKKTGLEGGAQFSSGFTSQLRRLSPVIRTLLGGALLGFVVQSLRRITTEVSAAVRAAGEVAQVERGFASLNVKKGLSPVETLAELRDATHGTVDAMELMRRSNLLLNSDLPLTSKNIGELARLTRRLAESQGKDAAEGFDRAARGIAKLEPELLDELGLTVRVEDATRKWANANHRSVESLTSAERQLAFYNAVVADARIKVAALGEEQVNAATRVQQVSAFWTDLKNATVLAIAETPRIEAFFNAIGVGASDAADRVQDLANRVGALLDSSSGSLLGTLIGGAAGATAGFLSPLPGGTLIGGALGAFAGSGVGQLADSGGPTFSEALARREAETAEKARRDELRGIQDINEALKKRAELSAELRDTQRENAQDTEAQKKLLGEIAAIDQAIVRIRSPKRGGDGTGTDKDPLKTEIEQLAKLKTLRGLSASEYGRVLTLEAQIRTALKGKNLELKEEVRLQTLLAELLSTHPDLIAPTIGLAGETENTRALRERQKELYERKKDFLAKGGTLEKQGLQLLGNPILPNHEDMDAFEKRYRSLLENVTEVSQQAAYEIASAFQDTFSRMIEEGANLANFMEGVGRGIAGAFLSGLAKLAQGKVAENIAEAIEMGAKALGFTALGNVASTAAAAASAAQHLAAAAAWGVLAGGAGATRAAVTGGHGAIPPSTRDVGLSTAQRADPSAPEINIYVNPWDSKNPLMQRSVYSAYQYAIDRYGEGAKITTK
jgi:hypothetical protein